MSGTDVQGMLDDLVRHVTMKYDLMLSDRRARVSNRHADAAYAIMKRILQEPNALQLYILPLLEHPTPAVRLVAAIQINREYPQVTEKVLTSLAIETGPVGMTAQISLDLLRKGELAPPV
jgi:hypothetical protein